MTTTSFQQTSSFNRLDRAIWMPHLHHGQKQPIKWKDITWLKVVTLITTNLHFNHVTSSSLASHNTTLQSTEMSVPCPQPSPVSMTIQEVSHGKSNSLMKYPNADNSSTTCVNAKCQMANLAVDYFPWSSTLNPKHSHPFWHMNSLTWCRWIQFCPLSIQVTKVSDIIRLNNRE